MAMNESPKFILTRDSHALGIIAAIESLLRDANQIENAERFREMALDTTSLSALVAVAGQFVCVIDQLTRRDG